LRHFQHSHPICFPYFDIPGISAKN
jgi:hypothetical protein